MQDQEIAEEQRTPNCLLCKEGNLDVSSKYNTRRGRYCYKFSKPETRKKLLQCTDRESLVLRVQKEEKEQLEIAGRTDLDSQMRSMGMCIWSWPTGLQEQKAAWVMNKRSTEMGFQTPYPSLALDELPAIFFDFYEVYNSAIGAYRNKRNKSG